MDEKKDSIEQDQIAPEKEKKNAPFTPRNLGCCKPKLEVDWMAVKADLAIPGSSLSGVARKWGINRATLSCQAARHGWRTNPMAIRAAVQMVAHHATQPIIEQAQEEAQMFVRETLELVRSGREKLAKYGNKPLNLSKLAVFADALDKLDKVGRRSLGLDAQQGNYNVGLAVSVNVDSGNQGENGVQITQESTEKAQAIDV